MRAARVRSRHFNGRQPSSLGKSQYFDCGMSLLWGAGGYARGKRPQYDFALKMQGGLMLEGGGGVVLGGLMLEGGGVVFAGHYGIISSLVKFCNCCSMIWACM